MTSSQRAARLTPLAARSVVATDFDERSAETASSHGKYRILTELGTGGMARVYLAVSQGLAGFNKLVVLKILKDDLAANEELRDGFMREARLLARMNHPNVVAVNEVDTRHGVPFIVMEHLQGQPFSTILRRILGKTSLDVPLRILSDSLSGLHYAHELADRDGTSLRIVHRDFTPQNIFVTYDGSVKVLDFGIAQVTRSRTQSKGSSVMGKLRYMAPEQIIGAAMDRRTDVFAAGVLLCEIVTGKRFWGTLNDSTIVSRMTSGNIPAPRDTAPWCPPELDRICARAIAFRPENRYHTVAEMQMDIEAFITTHSLRISNQDLGRRLTECFESERKDAQRLIDESLSDDTYVSWSRIPTVVTTLPLSQTPPATAAETMVELPRSLRRTGSPDTNNRRVFAQLTLLVGAGVLLTGGALLLRSPARPASTTRDSAEVSAAAPTSIAVRIAASPDSAALFLDDTPLPRNPFAGEYTIDNRWHMVRIQAPGHTSVEQRVQFLRNIDLVISLIPAADLAPAPTASPEPSSAASTHARHTARGRRPINRMQTSCSPPYTYDQRGVKRFKPECL